MPEVTVEARFNAARKLPPEDFTHLMDLLEAEKIRYKQPIATSNPFLDLVGGWADMGDEGIDEFDQIIERIRLEPGRDVDLVEDEEL
jgi:hypothetical protein